MPEPPPRFVALDVHKSYLVIGAVDGSQTIVLPPRRVTLAQFPVWAAKHFLSNDHVVLETTTNAWDLFDFLVPLVARVVVADPVQVKVIAASFVKTDKRDTLALARLLAANLIPAVWVPPPVVRELRALVAHRQRLIKQRTMAKNRLQSLLHRHNLPPPSTGDLFVSGQRAWWERLDLSPSERLRAQQDLALIDAFSPLIGTVEAELARLRKPRPLERADALPAPSARDRLDCRHDAPGGDWRHHPLLDSQTLGGLCGPGHTGPCFRPDEPIWGHYQAWTHRFAYHFGRSGLDCRSLCSPLGELAMSISPRACHPPKPLWRLRANSWSCCGISSRHGLRISMPRSMLLRDGCFVGVPATR